MDAIYPTCCPGSLKFYHKNSRFFTFSRYLGFKKTILLDRRLLVELIDKYTSKSLSWDQFSSAVKEAHAQRMGNPTKRLVIQDRPKEEDYFYANPEECLQPSEDKPVNIMQ